MLAIAFLAEASLAESQSTGKLGVANGIFEA